MPYRTLVAGTAIPSADINTEPPTPETVAENEHRHRQWLAAHPVAEQERRQRDANQAWERWFKQIR